MRPVEEVAVPVERYAEHAADDRDRVRLRVVVEQLHLAVLGERLQQLQRELRGRPAQRLDRARREGRGDELSDPRVIGRLEPEQAPAFRSPERGPARIERRRADLLRREYVPEVAPEALVPEAAADVLVAGDEPALPALVAEDAGGFAQAGQLGVRIRKECGVNGIEGERGARFHGVEGTSRG